LGASTSLHSITINYLCSYYYFFLSYGVGLRNPSPRAADALFVTGDGFFTSRRVQFEVLAVRHAIPTIYSSREYPEVGGLMILRD
jgi:hypothetical protein